MYRKINGEKSNRKGEDLKRKREGENRTKN